MGNSCNFKHFDNIENFVLHYLFLHSIVRSKICDVNSVFFFLDLVSTFQVLLSSKLILKWKTYFDQSVVIKGLTRIKLGERGNGKKQETKFQANRIGNWPQSIEKVFFSFSLFILRRKPEKLSQFTLSYSSLSLVSRHKISFNRKNVVLKHCVLPF